MLRHTQEELVKPLTEGDRDLLNPKKCTQGQGGQNTQSSHQKCDDNVITIEKKDLLTTLTLGDVGPIVVSKRDVKYAKKDRKEKLLENRLSQVEEAAAAARKSFF